MSRLARLRNLIVRKLTGLDADYIKRSIIDNSMQAEQIIEQNNAQSAQLSSLTDVLGRIDITQANSEELLLLAKSQRDNVSMHRRELWDVRATAEYSDVFADDKPLVSVRVASYNKTHELIHTAISSVLKQTYQNFEIIVVNDGPNEPTRKAIEKLNDKRIKYFEFPFRNNYPEDPTARWRVAGSPGMNYGAHLAKGRWIAPLDDDDAFTPDHIEKLLELALRTKSEMAYGALIQKNMFTSDENRIWSFPPEYSWFSFQAAIYMKCLDFFQYDQESWLVKEPGDWNLCRRMVSSGVKMASTADVVGVMNMTPLERRKG